MSARRLQQRVAVLDLPGFTKFEVTGAGAPAWLDHMVAGVVPKPGRTALNYFLNDKGGIVTEMTLTNLGGGRYWLISAAAGEKHDEHWLREHLPADGSVRIDNVSARYGSLIVVGPKSRELLAQLTRADLSNEAFPWLVSAHDRHRLHQGRRPARELRRRTRLGTARARRARAVGVRPDLGRG